MLEVVVATMLVMIGVIGVLSVQPQGWKLAAKTDKLSRAAELVHEELETNEVAIMNCCNALPATNTRTVFASGQTSSQTGDLLYTVQTTVTATGASQWRVKSLVTWTGNAVGISGSILVSTQENYRSPAGCACAH
jgi:hypothetical protein